MDAISKLTLACMLLASPAAGAAAQAAGGTELSAPGAEHALLDAL
jgi:hypothetical protein